MTRLPLLRRAPVQATCWCCATAASASSTLASSAACRPSPGAQSRRCCWLRRRACLLFFFSSTAVLLCCSHADGHAGAPSAFLSFQYRSPAVLQPCCWPRRRACLLPPLQHTRPAALQPCMQLRMLVPSPTSDARVQGRFTRFCKPSSRRLRRRATLTPWRARSSPSAPPAATWTLRCASHRLLSRPSQHSSKEATHAIAKQGSKSRTEQEMALWWASLAMCILHAYDMCHMLRLLRLRAGFRARPGAAVRRPVSHRAAGHRQRCTAGARAGVRAARHGRQPDEPAAAAGTLLSPVTAPALPWDWGSLPCMRVCAWRSCV